MAPGPHFVRLCTYIFVRSLRHTQFSSSQFCHGPSSFVVPISLCVLLTLSFLSSPMLPSTAPVPTPARISPLRTAPHHQRTSSPQGASFPMFSVSESIMVANRKGLKAGPRWRPTSDAKGSLAHAAHLITASHRWYISFTSMMYFSGTPCLSCSL